MRNGLKSAAKSPFSRSPGSQEPSLSPCNKACVPSSYAVPFVIALLIAEFFYKFHSFLLECLAFLATWFVLSFLQSLLMPNQPASHPKIPSGG